MYCGDGDRASERVSGRTRECLGGHHADMTNLAIEMEEGCNCIAGELRIDVLTFVVYHHDLNVSRD